MRSKVARRLGALHPMALTQRTAERLRGKASQQRDEPAHALKQSIDLEGTRMVRHVGRFAVGAALIGGLAAAATILIRSLSAKQQSEAEAVSESEDTDAHGAEPGGHDG
jgi:hypothetical protein